MFREMRRRPQLLEDEETLSIIENCSYGVLALIGDGGYPYTVPLNYVYSDGKIYFHGAKSGHKVDAIRNCDKACFCVVEKDKVVPEEYATHYSSVVAFGRIRILDEETEIRRSIEMLAARHGPGSREEDMRAIEAELAALCMFELSIEHITGKEAKALAQQRKK